MVRGPPYGKQPPRGGQQPAGGASCGRRAPPRSRSAGTAPEAPRRLRTYDPGLLVLRLPLSTARSAANARRDGAVGKAAPAQAVGGLGRGLVLCSASLPHPRRFAPGIASSSRHSCSRSRPLLRWSSGRPARLKKPGARRAAHSTLAAWCFGHVKSALRGPRRGCGKDQFSYLTVVIIYIVLSCVVAVLCGASYSFCGLPTH